MERVAFLIESTGERIGCLLNPNEVEISRRAGIERRQLPSGLLSTPGSSDDPLLYRGGGTTELLLNLLFDISVAGSTIQTTDVRELTRPLSRLAETEIDAQPRTTPPVVRFLWGKAWNIPGVVTAIAERLEQFAADGSPARSWLRMRLVRVSDDSTASDDTSASPLNANSGLSDAVGDGGVEDALHQVVGDGITSERLETIAWRHYGSTRAWRLIADANGLDNPAAIAPGQVLRVPHRIVRGSR